MGLGHNDGIELVAVAILEPEPYNVSRSSLHVPERLLSSCLFGLVLLLVLHLDVLPALPLTILGLLATRGEEAATDNHNLGRVGPEGELLYVIPDTLGWDVAWVGGLKTGIRKCSRGFVVRLWEV